MCEKCGKMIEQRGEDNVILEDEKKQEIDS